MRSKALRSDSIQGVFCKYNNKGFVKSLKFQKLWNLKLWLTPMKTFTGKRKRNFLFLFSLTFLKVVYIGEFCDINYSNGTDLYYRKYIFCIGLKVLRHYQIVSLRLFSNYLHLVWWWFYIRTWVSLLCYTEK